MSQSDDSYGEWLEDLYNVGRILLLIATVPGVLGIFFAALTSRDFGIDGGAYAMGTMVMWGLAIMVYATVKMRRRRRLQKVINAR